MATSTSIPDTTSTQASGGLLVLLTALPHEQIESVLDTLCASFPAEQLVIATAEEIASDSRPDLRIVPATSKNTAWSLTAEDFVQAHELATKHEASAVLILGPESGSLEGKVLRNLSAAILESQAGLAVPHYELSPLAGLLNSAILYPLSRSLFASRVRFPLAIDLGLSLPMLERLAMVAGRYTNLNQPGALVWPVNEACVAGISVAEVPGGPRALPQPAQPDLSAILPQITGSFFADIEKKASYWQRARQLPGARATLPLAAPAAADAADVASMIQGFRLAYSNLLEIWSLVLPPNTLLGLKRLSLSEVSEFRMPDTLWARVVFDFVLAYRLHTINRGHLLGALVPLYLAWVASHINIGASGVDPEQHIEAVAAAFEAEKPYILSRWRWPDRFNP